MCSSNLKALCQKQFPMPYFTDMFSYVCISRCGLISTVISFPFLCTLEPVYTYFIKQRIEGTKKIKNRNKCPIAEISAFMNLSSECHNMPIGLFIILLHSEIHN